MERMTKNKDIVVLGELEELQTSVFALAKSSLSDSAKGFIDSLKASAP
jgi:hypothetical protein